MARVTPTTPDPANPREADVVIVGAGVAGLTAAWCLRDRDVVVLEAESRVGGRLWSQPRGGYWLNAGGHVLAGAGSATARLLDETGVSAVEVPGVLSALALNGRVHARGRVETYPLRARLSARDRAALVGAGARLRLAVRRYGRVSAARPGESPAERQARVLEFEDGRTFAEFLGPVPPDVDEVFRATIRRSSGEPEQVSAGYGIGYFQLVWDRRAGLTRNIVGGSATLPERIADALGDRVLLGARVEQVREKDGVMVSYRHEGGTAAVRGRAVVMATPAPVTAALVSGLPRDTAEALTGVAYGPYVVGAFLTAEHEPMPYDDIYAMATPKRSFNMLFNTASAVRGGTRRPGGSLMVYSGARLAERFDTASDDEVASLYQRELIELFPQLRGQVEETLIIRWPRGLPHPRPGRGALQPALTRSLGRVFLAGDYLGTSYVETAVQTGATVAASARALLAG
jgi:protoporphyrinogen/coproporphyrinogen III oxidase